MLHLLAPLCLVGIALLQLTDFPSYVTIGLTLAVAFIWALRKPILRLFESFGKNKQQSSQTPAYLARDSVSNLLANSPMPIFGMRPNGSVDYCNSMGLKLAAHISDIIQRDSNFRQKLSLLINSSETLEQDMELEKRHYSVLFSGNTESGLINVYARDISDKLTSQEALNEARIAREGAERANKLKGQFLANMSHEIRTPLNAVIGHCSLIEAMEITKEQREMVQAIKVSSDSLMSLINDVLDFSKIEAGEIFLEEETFSPQTLLEESCRIFNAVCDEKTIQLLSCLDQQMPKTLIGDGPKIKQILVNLIGNATKFTTEGTIVVRLFLVSQRASRAILGIEVIDTGIGMSQATVDKLFKPFMQAETAVSKHFGGTGLGLSISRSLTTLMSGDITVSSREREGSTFRVEISVRRVPGAEVCFNKLPAHKAIFLSENQIMGRELIVMLANWGMDAQQMNSTAELESYLAVTPKSDASIIVDLSLGIQTAMAFGKTLKKEAPNCRSLLLSKGGYAIKGMKVRSEEHGYDYFSTSPFSSERFHAILAAMISGKKLEQEQTSSTTDTPKRRIDEDFKEVKSISVLVVEDNQLNQMLMKRILERLGHECTTAYDGTNCLEILQERSNFDLILMDYRMPGLTGAETSAKIRENDEWSNIPIIALTADVTKETKEIFESVGVSTLLTKPIKMHKIAAIIERLQIK